jgi:hypothetical protein
MTSPLASQACVPAVANGLIMIAAITAPDTLDNRDLLMMAL